MSITEWVNAQIYTCPQDPILPMVQRDLEGYYAVVEGQVLRLDECPRCLQFRAIGEMCVCGYTDAPPAPCVSAFRRGSQAGIEHAIATLEARIRQLEQDADPRTAQGAALDRWARIVGLTDREPGETDEQLRARIEGDDMDDEPEDDAIDHSGATPGRSWAEYGTAIHEAVERTLAVASESTGIPRHLLAGTEPAGLAPRPGVTYTISDTCTRPWEYQQIEDVTWTAASALPPGVLALAIGTRVRIDDKALAWHDDVGTILAVPGPGTAPDVYAVEIGGSRVTLHRSQLALVDDTLPECDACHGAGTIALFSSLVDCSACGGSGVVRP